MKEGRPSFSAEVVAAMRALESKKPAYLRICYDPYAKYLIRSSFRLLAKSRLITKYGLKYIEHEGPGFPAGIAARTRYIDDIVRNQVNDGAKQVVILGAGLDARAFRLRELQNVSVFEVDFPATQSYKQTRLKRLSGLPKDHITYVPIDFNKDKLEEVLTKAGYDPNVRTVFTWEGVTMYLDAEAVDGTLAFIARNKAIGTTLYFDYFLKSVLDGTCQNPE
ncbi:MAG: SAM-dependent methyltransferase, partial [Flavobacteriales bacterium]|nr:SAM-dependent methyltransferase [Flavobacteriales bacterium]